MSPSTLKTVINSSFGDVTLTRRRGTRHLRLRVRPYDGIEISAPWSINERRAMAFLQERGPWISRELEKAGRQEKRMGVLISTAGKRKRSELKRVLGEHLTRIMETTGYRCSGVSYRTQSSRWGSCSSKGRINLNLALALLPTHLSAYVIIHELVHTRHHHHGRQFWQALEETLPGARALDRELKHYPIPPPELYLH